MEITQSYMEITLSYMTSSPFLMMTYITSSQVITLVTIIVGSIMFHIYALTYADRPAVRPKTSGPFCLDVNHVPYKTIQDKEIEV